MRTLSLGLSAALGATALYYLYRRRKSKPISPTEKMVVSGPPIHVWYGSQTGTSETFARDLVEEARSLFDISIHDAVSVESIASNLLSLLDSAEERVVVILVVSTYGEGDPSDDAIEFNEILNKLGEEEISFKKIDFAIFGCGNRQYALFNEMAKRTEKNLLRLGARQLCPTGLGDDNADIESDFTSWKVDMLWKCFSNVLGLKLNEGGSRKNPMDRLVLDMQVAEKRSKLKFDACVSSSGTDVLSKFFFAANLVPVVAVRQLCTNKTQIDIDISKVPCLRYRSGDTLEILPKNRSVDPILNRYKLDGNHLMTFVKKKDCRLLTVKKPFPTPVGLKFALETYIDLHGVPSRSLIRDLCCVFDFPDPDSLVERRDSAVAAGKVFTVQMLLDLLFPTKNVELGDLIQLLPKQKARGYSICSSPLEDAKRISVIVSRVDDNALASTFLCDIVKPNDLLSVSLRQGTFRLPSLPGTPVIMIAAGTGVAPFRAFITELGIKNRCTSAHLFFGCRNMSEWIYKDEMESFKSNGGYLHVAFSREDNRCYVQDLVRERGDELKQLIERRNAVVYVCGSTKMGLDVMDVFNNVVKVDVASLRNLKQYFEELWG